MCLDLAHGKPLLYRVETEQRTVGADSLPANIQTGRNATVRMSEHFVLWTVRQGGAESPSANILTARYADGSDVRTFCTATGPPWGADSLPVNRTITQTLNVHDNLCEIFSIFYHSLHV